MKIVFSDNGYRFIWLSVLPVVLLHIFFLNYSVQDFTVLYASLFFSVLIGILYDKVKKSGAVPINRLRVGVGLIVALFMVQYFAMNSHLINDFSANKREVYEASGNNIDGPATKDQVVFILNRTAEPQEVFYAHRNIRYAKSAKDAIDFLNSRQLKKGAVFSDAPKWDGSITGEFALEKVTTINLDSI